MAAARGTEAVRKVDTCIHTHTPPHTTQGVVDDPGAVDRMVTELQEKQEKNKKFSRRRTALDAED